MRRQNHGGILGRLGLAFAVVVGVACGSSQSSTTPTAVVATPTPTPAPTPAPTPTPTPIPGPGPVLIGPGVSCSASSSNGTSCRTESAVYRNIVELSQSDVRRTRPDLFTGAFVKDQDAYVREVARVIGSRGYCAQGGPGDQIGVKTTNIGSERYDIVLGSGEPWTGYVSTCRPSHF
jgi:hypothetical protein